MAAGCEAANLNLLCALLRPPCQHHWQAVRQQRRRDPQSDDGAAHDAPLDDQHLTPIEKDQCHFTEA